MTRILTATQRNAIDTRAPLTACIAGPGSGKTTVLTARVHSLIQQGVSPSGIAAITFTNQAANVLRQRIGADVGVGYIGTLHSYALRALREWGGFMGYGDRAAVIDEAAALDLLSSQMKAQNCKASMTKLIELKRLGRPLRRNEDGTVRRLTVEETTIARYYDDLSDSGLLDLEGILPEFARLLRLYALPNDPTSPLARMAPLSDLLVDEAQDSSAQDWAVYNALPAFRKFVVGDPDQAIYSFRGGRQDLLIEFANRPGVEVISLEENFRCAPGICAAANRLIAHNTQRIPKETRSGTASTISHLAILRQAMNEGMETGHVAQAVLRVINEDTETRAVDPAQIAVLCRSNAIAVTMREGLAAVGIPVDVPPRADVPPDWSLAQSLVELLAQPSNDRLAFFYVMAREIRDGTTQREAREKAHEVKLNAARTRQSINAIWFNLPKDPNISYVAELLEKERVTAETRAKILELWAQMPPGSQSCAELALEMERAHHVSGGAERAPTGVTVTTIHGAKGREWDAVVLAGFEDEVIPGRSIKAELVEEERRVAFVGITRARKILIFSSSETRRATWGRQEILKHKPSRFIEEAMA